MKKKTRLVNKKFGNGIFNYVSFNGITSVHMLLKC